MTGRFNGRVRALEAARRGASDYVVTMPEDAWGDPDAWDAVIAAHRARTGYRGPVIVAPETCDSAEGWRRRYGRPEGRADGCN